MVLLAWIFGLFSSSVQMAQLKGIRLDLWLGVSLNNMDSIMRKHLASGKNHKCLSIARIDCLQVLEVVVDGC